MSLYDCLGYGMGVTVARHNRSLSGTPPDDTLLTTPSRQALCVHLYQLHLS